MYRALRLLADCGRGEVIGSLAREGGLESVLWAGPEQLGGARRTGTTQGTTRTRPVSLELGFASDDFGYLIDLGLPQSAGHGSLFARDPEIKREAVFAGPRLRTSSTLVRRGRDYAEAAAESGRGFDELSRSLPPYRSVLAEYAHPDALPELAAVRDRLRGWRFYDGFRVDAAAPARRPQVGTRTPVLSDDGGDLAAAVQTIIEAGFDDLPRAVADAFDGATVSVAVHDGLFELATASARHAASAARGRIVRRHTAFPAVGRRAAEPAAAVADGAQRTGDIAAPRPGGAAGGHDPIGRRGAPRSWWSRTRRRCANTSHTADAAEIELHKQWGETRITGQTMVSAPPWDWGRR